MRPLNFLLWIAVFILAAPMATQAQTPPNDLIANAIPLMGSNGVVFASNRHATLEEGERQDWPYVGGASLWWKWTAPADGFVYFDTEGSSIETVLLVYSQDVSVRASYRAFGSASVATGMSKPVAGGNTYFISVDGILGMTGDITLNYSMSPLPPRYFIQPKDTTVLTGQTCAFNTTSAAWQYQWRKDGVGISGETNSSLVITNCQLQDSGLYSVRLENEVGYAVSREAVVTVVERQIVGPANTTVAEGGDAGFSVAVEGGPPVTYQWLRNGVPILEATNTTYTLRSAKLTESGTTFAARISDSFTNVQTLSAVLTVVPAYTFVTLAGRAKSAGSVDGQRGMARFASPHGIAVDDRGYIYVTDLDNYTIRKISPGGFATTIAGAVGQAGSTDGSGINARFKGPWGIAVAHDYSLIVADTEGNRVRKISVAGDVTTLAGHTGLPGYRDGAATNALFRRPADVAVDAEGVIYVADYNNHTIRRIMPDGSVNSFAGTSTWGRRDGLRPIALFYCPVGLGTDGFGNLYVADEVNCSIRRIQTNGVVRSLGGTAGFRYPHGAKVDAAGNIFIADYENCVVKRMGADGNAAVIGGSFSSGTTDGTGSAARFSKVRGVAVDRWDNIYVTDYDNNTIRKGWPSNATHPPEITEEPRAQTVLVGNKVRLNVAAGGTGLFGYQWYKNGVPVQGQTNDYLVLSPIQTTESGGYSVLITNAFGSVASREVQVQIIAPQVLRAPELLSDGTVRLWFQPSGGGPLLENPRLYVEWRSAFNESSLETGWEMLATPVFQTNGFYTVCDTNQTLGISRFYRIVEQP
jgi:sugar lactone lactonase YvrE